MEKTRAHCWKHSYAILAFAWLALGLSISAGHAQQEETPLEEPATALVKPTKAPYENEMKRLANVLGSLHYLRNLCGETGNGWREQMESLIVADQIDGTRREQMIAAFNNGYRGFSAVHTTCTPTALAAIDLYMAEGKELTNTILTRFKN